MLKCLCGKDITNSKIYLHLKNKCNLNHTKKFNDFCATLVSQDIIDNSISRYTSGESINDCRILIHPENISRAMFIALLNERGVHVRTISEMGTSVKIKKYANTCLEKYGCDNMSKLDFIKEKKANTFIEHYGVDNVRKCPDFRENHGFNKTMMERYNALSLPNRYGNRTKKWQLINPEERRKIARTMIDASTVKWYSLTDVEKYAIIEKRLNTLIRNYPDGLPLKPSYLENRLINIFKSSNIIYKHQKWIYRKSYDFLLDHRCILEVQGDYWHAFPGKYDENHIFKRKGLHGMTAREIWDADANKKEIAEKYGYSVYYLWEHEMNAMSDEDILNFVYFIQNDSEFKNELKNQHKTNEVSTDSPSSMES